MTITVVCGPPVSGKTTLVKKKMKWGDVVVDMDAIYASMTYLPNHQHPENLVKLCLEMRDRLIESAVEQHRKKFVANVWIIRGAARIKQRYPFAQNVGAHAVIVLETSVSTCYQHVQKDKTRLDPDQWLRLIKKWWDEYERDERDTVIES